MIRWFPPLCHVAPIFLFSLLFYCPPISHRHLNIAYASNNSQPRSAPQYNLSVLFSWSATITFIETFLWKNSTTRRASFWGEISWKPITFNSWHCQPQSAEKKWKWMNVLLFSQFLSRLLKNRPWINIVEQYFCRTWNSLSMEKNRRQNRSWSRSARLVKINRLVVLLWPPLIVLYSYCRFARTEKYVNARAFHLLYLFWKFECRTSQETNEKKNTFRLRHSNVLAHWRTLMFVAYGEAANEWHRQGARVINKHFSGENIEVSAVSVLIFIRCSFGLFA